MHINLTAQTFNRWTVLEPDGKTRHGSAVWKCRCECGTIRSLDGQSLRKGTSKSCGCLRDERTKASNTKHGESINRTPSAEFTAFYSAKARCENPNNSKYSDYGGRGIQFRFTSVKQFIATVGRKPSKLHSIERIDVNGNYEPGNVRWATSRDQSNNRRNTRVIKFGVQRLTIGQWAIERHIPAATIRTRIFQHRWCDTCAVTIPVWGGSCPHR